jgi:hypothetical protein
VQEEGKEPQARTRVEGKEKREGGKEKKNKKKEGRKRRENKRNASIEYAGEYTRSRPLSFRCFFGK